MAQRMHNSKVRRLKMSKKRKKEIYLAFIKTLERLGLQAINCGVESNDPIEQVRVVCDYIKERFNENNKKRVA